MRALLCFPACNILYGVSRLCGTEKINELFGILPWRSCRETPEFFLRLSAIFCSRQIGVVTNARHCISPLVFGTEQH